MSALRMRAGLRGEFNGQNEALLRAGRALWSGGVKGLVRFSWGGQ